MKLQELKNSANYVSKVNKWLDTIGEHDEVARSEVLELCDRDMDARKYFISQAEAV